MEHNPQHQGYLSQTFQLHPELTLPIRSIHLPASPSVLCAWWCYCCWEPAPAGLAGLLPAGRGRHGAVVAAADGRPSLMSLWAPHTEPAGMVYCAWSVGAEGQGSKIQKCPLDAHSNLLMNSAQFIYTVIFWYTHTRGGTRKSSISLFWLTHISSDDTATNIETHHKKTSKIK